MLFSAKRNVANYLCSKFINKYKIERHGLEHGLTHGLGDVMNFMLGDIS